MSFWAVSFLLAAQAPRFADTAYPALEKGSCAACHKANGVASETRFRMPAQKLSAERLEQFGRSLHRLVNRGNPAMSPLLAKPIMAINHGGGKRFAPDSAEAKALRTWVDYLAATDPKALPERFDEEIPAGGHPILRRLTHAQYDNTVRDLLGDDSRIGESFPPEDFVNGFRNQYQAQATSPLQAEAYAQAAEKLARKAFTGGDPRGLIPCKPTMAHDTVCRDKFIREFGLRAFRRPLTPVETTRYARLFATPPTFADGARAVVEAMLQSPNFLLRVENGQDARWKPYETASRLSYFLWNSMPDNALLDAAAKGELGNAAGIEKHARRMLDSAKARTAIHEFLADWLRFDRVQGAVRERAFTNEIRTAMIEETRRLVDHLVWSNGNFMEVFSADYAFLNSTLAKLYGVPEPASGYERVALPESTGRGGVLGQGTFLTLTSKPSDTSPTARGLFVREQFLCQEVPQPPPGVNSNLPTVTKERPMTNRERLAVHLSNDSCSSCHRLIDPIGFGLEKYDAIGRHRPSLKITVNPTRGDRGEEPAKFDLPLDTTGSVAGLKDSNFTTPRELGRVLASSDGCQRCVVKQLFRYATGRHEELADEPVVNAAFADFKASGFRFQELIVSLAKRL